MQTNKVQPSYKKTIHLCTYIKPTLTNIVDNGTEYTTSSSYIFYISFDFSNNFLGNEL